jgi:hypothetical protein
MASMDFDLIDSNSAITVWSYSADPGIVIACKATSMACAVSAADQQALSQQSMDWMALARAAFLSSIALHFLVRVASISSHSVVVWSNSA